MQALLGSEKKATVLLRVVRLNVSKRVAPVFWTADVPLGSYVPCAKGIEASALAGRLGGAQWLIRSI